MNEMNASDRRHVLLIYNAGKPEAIERAQGAKAWLLTQGCKVKMVEHTAATRMDALPVEHTDLIVTLGGDGTMLTGARLGAPAGVPVLGVHLGRFGFIAQILPHRLEEALQVWLQDEYQIQERLMVQARVGSEEHAIYGLNEIAFLRAPTAPMLTFRIQVNGLPLTSYPADGTLVATPTGSTGYALSAGAPVIHPETPALVLVAISPHTLGARPLVIPPNSRIEITTDAYLQEDVGGSITTHDALLMADGNQHRTIAPGQTIHITQAPFRARLLIFNEADFFEKLRDRLLWGVRVNE